MQSINEREVEMKMRFSVVKESKRLTPEAFDELPCQVVPDQQSFDGDSSHERRRVEIPPPRSQFRGDPEGRVWMRWACGLPYGAVQIDPGVQFQRQIWRKTRTGMTYACARRR